MQVTLPGLNRHDLLATKCPNGATMVSIANVNFNYQHEYLGVKERLVTTTQIGAASHLRKPFGCILVVHLPVWLVPVKWRQQRI
jgi:hypothetical protein